MEKLPDVFFGSVKKIADTSKKKGWDDELDPDDDELDETPEDVVELLGFDPKEKD